MALKVKYKDEHGILHINMSPSSTPRDPRPEVDPKTDITDPKFDTINNRFGQYDLFGGKYDVDSERPSLFRSRYNSIEEELANTPYAFTDRLRSNLGITIDSRAETSPSKDIEDDRFFNRNLNIEYDGLFGPQIDCKVKSDDETPAFTVTQLIHAQDRYFDLSSRQSSDRVSLTSSCQVKSAPSSGKARTVRGVSDDEAFRVLPLETAVKAVQVDPVPTIPSPAVPTAKRKKESSFAIITETPVASRPSSPRSLPVETRTGRVSPFKGRGFREETSRHTTPKTSAANSRACSPPRRRTHSLSRLDKMAQIATLPLPIPTLSRPPSRPHSPRDFVRQNIEEVRELSELNREKHEAEAEQQRREEEEALLREMGLLPKTPKSDAIRSIVCSRTTSRSNSPSKLKLRSRSSSPAAILHFENIKTGSTEFINKEDGLPNGIPKPATHRSRVRSVSKSQPQSNDGSPKHSKIPKRQNSVSPDRTLGTKRDTTPKRLVSNLAKSPRFISNSTSSIHETIKIGSQVHDKRAMSKSTQFLGITPNVIKGKPPISPGRGGPPPSNKAINAKRLSPIVGTPNKSPIEDNKPNSARTPTKPSTAARKPIKTAGNTPATSRLNSRQPSRAVSRDPSPEKRRTVTKSSVTSKNTTTTTKPTKPVSRALSSRTPQKPTVPVKSEPKKPINRTNSMKSLTRTPSTKTLNEKPPILKKRDSKRDLKEKVSSTTKINEIGKKNEIIDRPESKVVQKSDDSARKSAKKEVENQKNGDSKVEAKSTADSSTGGQEITTQDNETQYDKITNEKGELIILTKKNIVSMTTAAITAQPLEVVTTVTNQLPAALEKAREKAILERLNSKDSIAGKDDEEKNKDGIEDKDKSDDKKLTKPVATQRSIFSEDNVKLKPLQPPYNNPQVERVKQKIDSILKEPEVSAENILSPPVKPKEFKSTFKSIADKTKSDIKGAKDEAASKLTSLKDQVVKQNEKMASEIRSEATKIVNSIITPVEEPNKLIEKAKEEVKKDIEPIVMVVNEKKNGPKADIVEKMTETLVKGDAEVEVQSSNLSTPGVEKMVVQNKMVDGASDKSSQSNGGFPQSTSTTPKPPARVHRKQSKDESKSPSNMDSKEPTPESETKKPNICQRLMGKCKSKCCPCCVKPADEEEKETKDIEAPVEEKKTGMSKFSFFKKKDVEEGAKDAESAAGKASIEFENETKKKRKLRDIMCGCCGRRRRVSDVSEVIPRQVADMGAPGVVQQSGCCGKKRPEIERRDSILSDRPPTTCCNNRLCTWLRGACRRGSERDLSRRPSVFSKHKSLSPTLPPEVDTQKATKMIGLKVTPAPSPQPSRKMKMMVSTDFMKRDIDIEEDIEDTRTKLDPSLIEHTSMMRGAIPVLPAVLAYFCLVCNVLIPGFGTILSGMFCLCFGIPRFGPHDGAKHRIGSFLINLVVGAAQLFTVLFCLVGWGWSIWWGVIMVKTSRKYKKLKAEAALEEAEAAPPVTANNHTRA